MTVRNAKENKAIAKKNENIIHGDLLCKPCSDFYHVGDERLKNTRFPTTRTGVF